jgi:hypothetical protein
VDTIIESRTWKKSLATEQTNKDRLTLVKENWDDVAMYAEENYTPITKEENNDE